MVRNVSPNSQLLIFFHQHVLIKQNHIEIIIKKIIRKKICNDMGD